MKFVWFKRSVWSAILVLALFVAIVYLYRAGKDGSEVGSAVFLLAWVAIFSGVFRFWVRAGIVLLCTAFFLGGFGFGAPVAGQMVGAFVIVVVAIASAEMFNIPNISREPGVIWDQIFTFYMIPVIGLAFCLLFYIARSDLWLVFGTPFAAALIQMGYGISLGGLQNKAIAKEARKQKRAKAKRRRK